LVAVDLGGQVIHLFAGTLTGKSGGGGQHQAVELIWVDQREAGEHPRVDPITFGVTLIVAAEIGDLLTIDEIHWNRLPRVTHGAGKPCDAGRLHHDLHLGGGCAVTRPREQLIQFTRLGVDGQEWGAEVAMLIQHHRFVSGLNSQVETNGAHTTSFHMI
jgi:hypothetical protein